MVPYADPFGSDLPINECQLLEGVQSKRVISSYMVAVSQDQEILGGDIPVDKETDIKTY